MVFWFSFHTTRIKQQELFSLRFLFIFLFFRFFFLLLSFFFGRYFIIHAHLKFVRELKAGILRISKWSKRNLKSSLSLSLLVFPFFCRLNFRTHKIETVIVVKCGVGFGVLYRVVTRRIVERNF